MKLSNSMQQAINKQINAEIYSGYMYLSMASYFDAEGWSGFASWMKVQAKEEYEHAMKFYGYVYERGGEVTLAGIDTPPTRWDSPLAAFTEGYKHEQKVTKMIHDLAKLSVSEDDLATHSMLQWFIDEQVEEEDNALGIVEKLEKIGESTNGLFMLDHALGNRE